MFHTLLVNNYLDSFVYIRSCKMRTIKKKKGLASMVSFLKQALFRLWILGALLSSRQDYVSPFEEMT